jgi:hypothetical protein
MAGNKSQILTGARAKILINGKLVGLFSQCSWSVNQDKQPAFILGRYNPAEITPTTQEPVRMTLNGYRVVEAGPYRVANATLLKNLLNEEDFTVAVLDRQTGKTIFMATGCRVQGWSSGVASRGVSDIRIEIVAAKGEDEYGLAAGGDDEGATAASLDDGT